MKVYVVIETNTYEYLGVYATRARAEREIENINADLPNTINNLEIIEREIDARAE